MTLIATDHPLVPTEAIAELEEKGYRIFLSTESSLEAGNGAQVLQVIRLEDGEYQIARIPQTASSTFLRRSAVVPEIGEVTKWLTAEGFGED